MVQAYFLHSYEITFGRRPGNEAKVLQLTKYFHVNQLKSISILAIGFRVELQTSLSFELNLTSQKYVYLLMLAWL